MASVLSVGKSARTARYGERYRPMYIGLVYPQAQPIKAKTVRKVRQSRQSIHRVTA